MNINNPFNMFANFELPECAPVKCHPLIGTFVRRNSTPSEKCVPATLLFHRTCRISPVELSWGIADKYGEIRLLGVFAVSNTGIISTI